MPHRECQTFAFLFLKGRYRGCKPGPAFGALSTECFGINLQLGAGKLPPRSPSRWGELGCHRSHGLDAAGCQLSGCPGALQGRGSPGWWVLLLLLLLD